MRDEPVTRQFSVPLSAHSSDGSTNSFRASAHRRVAHGRARAGSFGKSKSLSPPRTQDLSAKQARMERSASAVISVKMSAVLLVYLINFLDTLGGSISTPILAFYSRKYFGATYSQVGQLFSVFALAQTLAMPVLGRLSDVFGRRKVLILSVIGTAIGSFWQGRASSFESLLVARAFSGIWAGVASVCQIYIADVVPDELRPEYLSYLLSSNQAAQLFGPSMGAGLSVLGLNMPVLTQAMVSTLLIPIVWYYLPESPEWLRLHQESLSAPPSPFQFASPKTMELGARSDDKKIRPPPQRTQSLGAWGTYTAIAVYGGIAFSGMVAQMSMVSMYAVFAKAAFDLDSLQVGFATTLGAIASVSTNIWISPWFQRYFGDTLAGFIGCVFLVAGALGTILQALWISLASFMIAYLGIALNASAVAVGSANLTDGHNRATVMTSVRMLKALGAVMGPLISGTLASRSTRSPFLVAALFAAFAAMLQIVFSGAVVKIRSLVIGRRTVGLESGLLEGHWQDEYGTPEEILDLGEYLSNLLTKRHYRWVTHNVGLKKFLSDSFPLLPTDSEDDHRAAYDRLRERARSCAEQSLMVDDRC